MFYIIHVHVLMYTVKCKMVNQCSSQEIQCQLHVRYGILLYLYQHPHIFISLYQSHGDILSLSYYYVNFVIYVSDLGFLVKFYRTILYIGLLAYTCSLDTIALMNISDGNGILGHFSESSILIIRKLSGYVTVLVSIIFVYFHFHFMHMYTSYT